MGVARELQQFAAGLRLHQRYVVMSHVHPDGDSIGSMLALSRILEALGKEVTLVGEDPVPGAYQFLPGQETICVARAFVAAGKVPLAVDAAIIVDCSDLGRTGEAGRLIPAGVPLFNVDHHLNNEIVGTKYVRTSAAATGELLYELACHLGVELDEATAICLYTALMTDTGGFRYANTTAATLRAAADLVARGVSPSRVAEQAFEVKPLASLRLLGELLTSLQVSSCGRVAWLVITLDQMHRLGVASGDTEGFVDYARQVAGVKVGILFREVAPGLAKVSWRSRPGVNVSTMAARFGGGGHVNAAGCEIAENIDDAVRAGVAVAVEELGCMAP